MTDDSVSGSGAPRAPRAPPRFRVARCFRTALSLALDDSMTVSLTSAPAAAVPHAERLYARFSRRFRALVIDSAVYAASLVVLVLGGGLLDTGRALAGAATLLWLGFVLLYEPLLVWRRGATVGHFLANCRVVDARTGGTPGFWRAWARFWLKSLAGLFAFVFMATTRRHQALHDLAFGTVVEIRDPARARTWDYARERPAESLEVAVPAWRRVAVIFGYSIVGYLVFGFALLFSESAACFELDQCSPGERLWESVLGFAWLGTQAAWIVFGWRGRLFGARAGRGRPGRAFPHAGAPGA